ncbi:hypothetical protein N7U68_13155 [Roseovarius pelagicus]|uniref:Uncharacterized protein n=1 Tax=Roseovarius pelagicus TaxID=2980108 RepID=A0ABY6DA42_9RHOB|nr:hypothetical protein [Roseovarius pelagicus]UXX82053.1 hypothetical protein N7U68_13155 [Roseovarius pelagicus]
MISRVGSSFVLIPKSAAPVSTRLNTVLLVPSRTEMFTPGCRFLHVVMTFGSKRIAIVDSDAMLTLPFLTRTVSPNDANTLSKSAMITLRSASSASPTGVR